MRTILTALLLLVGIASAQQGGDAGRTPQKDATNNPAPVTILRRLEAVTYDLQQGQLIWVISVWDLESDMSKPADLERYVIHIDSDVMQSNGELRRFYVPALDLHALTDILGKYAIRSTIWWAREAAADDSPGLAPDSTSKGKTKDRDEDDKTKRAFINRVAAPARGH
jgi:hypothetical protein